MKIIFASLLFALVAGVVAMAAQDVTTRADRARALLDDAAAALSIADSAPDQ